MALQQEGFYRKKRGYRDINEIDINMNDPLFTKQWYLINTGQADGTPGLDLNVAEAWELGYTGKGVTIGIMDDGIDYLHPDLASNYNAEASYDFSSNDPYPYPRYTDDWFNSCAARGMMHFLPLFSSGHGHQIQHPIFAQKSWGSWISLFQYQNSNEGLAEAEQLLLGQPPCLPHGVRTQKELLHSKGSGSPSRPLHGCGE
ncbi:hypothetical protein CB1_000474006 [Camelus ferus]|nr:hypothetical protein CB1_000474006 [Camelus ferus]